jgi:hypothetical protein
MEHLALFIQQAAAAKAIGILARQSNLIADQFLSVGFISVFVQNRNFFLLIKLSLGTAADRSLFAVCCWQRSLSGQSATRVKNFGSIKKRLVSILVRTATFSSFQVFYPELSNRC